MAKSSSAKSSFASHQFQKGSGKMAGKMSSAKEKAEENAEPKSAHNPREEKMERGKK